MTLVLGTNCGFVTTAPTADPNGLDVGNIDGSSFVMRDKTSDWAGVKVTEIGFWVSNDTAEADFDVGIYNANGAVVPGEAGTAVYRSARDNAKGTTSGWKKKTGLNIELNGDTDYWIGTSLELVASATQTNRQAIASSARDTTFTDPLPDPFGGASFTDGETYAFYAVVEEITGGRSTVINLNLIH